MNMNRSRCALCIAFALLVCFCIRMNGMRTVRAAGADAGKHNSAGATLEVKQQADYACDAGALIEMSALIHIASTDETAENLVIKDAFPTGLTLLGQAVSGAEDVTVEAYRENGWKVRCPQLSPGQTLVIVSECKVETSAAGRELLNVVRVKSEHTDTIRSARDLWVNTAELGIYQSCSQPSWREGESVLWQVICYNETADTLIRNLSLSGLTPPDGLSVQSEEDVTLRGLKKIVDVPRSDNRTGIHTTSQQNVCNLSRTDEGWELSLAYLPGQQPLLLQFSCVAVQEGQAEAVAIAAVGEQVGNAILHEMDWPREPLLSADLKVVNHQLLTDARRLSDEFQVGETVEYELVIENLSDCETLKNVIVSDHSLPEGLKLKQVWAGEEEVTRRITRQQQGFYFSLGEIQPEGIVILRYCCRIKKSANGMELLTQASVQADNAVRVNKTARIWVNSPELIVEQETDRRQEFLQHTITVRQANTGCAARNLVLENVIDGAREQVLEDSVRILDENGAELDLEFWVLGNHLFIHTDFLLVRDACYEVFDAAHQETVLQAIHQPTGRRERTQLTIEFSTGFLSG